MTDSLVIDRQPHTKETLLHSSWYRAVGSIAWVLAACASSAAQVSPIDRLPPRPDLEVTVMGDSYGAGTGTSRLGTGPCARGETSPAGIVAEAMGAHFTNLACAGQNIIGMSVPENGRPPQLNRLFETNPDIVVVSAGGNDVIDFQAILSYCMNPANDCSPSSEVYRESLKPQPYEMLVASLANLYDSILSAAPRATVMVTEYPKSLDNSPACTILAKLASILGVPEAELAQPGKARLIADVTDAVNQAINQAIKTLKERRPDLAKRIYVVPAPDMAVCQGMKVSLNFVTWPQADLSSRAQGHPSKAGNTLLADKIAAQLFAHHIVDRR